MSYAHDAEAEFAASELARMFLADPKLCYAAQNPPTISTSATYEPSGTRWPKADGVVLVVESGATSKHRGVAVEYKRTTEGVHGLLTGLGQAEAYVHKGYDGAVLVVPRSYPSLAKPGDYLADVLKTVANHAAIGVVHYDSPDLTSATPFAKRLHFSRKLTLTATTQTSIAGGSVPHTQWVHMREGSTTRDALFRFLQTAKRVSAGAVQKVRLSQEIEEAVERVAPGADPVKYLSNAPNDDPLSRVWRDFWFRWLANEDTLTPWDQSGKNFFVHKATTGVERDDGDGKSVLWEGQWGKGGLKSKLVEYLTSGLVSEEEAWDLFVSGNVSRKGKHLSGAAKKTQGVRQRAHSYREDVDSSLAHLGWIDPDGQPTEYGHRFVAICERYEGGANSNAAKNYFGATLLQAGRYGAFLHYLYRLSEEFFSAEPLRFTSKHSKTGKPVFDDDSYYKYLGEIEKRLTDDLRVQRKVSQRSADRERKAFQAELTLLRQYGFVSEARYRLGVGVTINWPNVQEAMHMDL